MNSQKHKIAAFTLSELIIVILITIIVAGIAFSVLNLVQKQMFGIQDNFQHATSVRLLEQSLLIDAQRANHMEYNEDEATLHFISEIDTVTYTFAKEYIENATDTFAISITGAKTYFKGLETTAKKIDAFKLTTTKEFRNATVFIYQRNTANTYMNP
jgi:type II secretory pathway pseudopilin PulG